ncbi:MAG: Flp pilus assembly complex ATPase component TadA, partial [Immundisolibacteraceae bacterium]|nr:Flp pilus assembly complex ATPase component TadA [Immundisolibacteraceae bacterium]
MPDHDFTRPSLNDPQGQDRSTNPHQATGQTLSSQTATLPGSDQSEPDSSLDNLSQQVSTLAVLSDQVKNHTENRDQTISISPGPLSEPTTPAPESVKKAPAITLRIGDYLLEQGIINEEQLKAGLAEQKSSGRKLGQVLVDSKILTELVLKQALANQLGLPFIDLAQFDLNQSLVQKIEERHARRYRALVLKERSGGYLVGMVDPTDLFAFDELSKKLDRPVLPAVVCQQELLQALEDCYQRSVQISSLATELQADIDESYFDLDNLGDDQEVTDAPVVRLLQTIFEDAVRKNASDIHIEPDESVLRIRNRIDGLLHEHVMDEKRIAPALVSRLKLMAGLDISEKRLPQDGRFSVHAGEKSLD